MGTVTAQILIGSPHPNDGGIIPSHYLFLSENDRPSWNLVGANIFQESGKEFSKIVWIPALENMVEDAVLMVAVHILKNEEIVNMAREFSNKIDSQLLELRSDLDDDQRDRLYQKCRELTEFPKMIISIFKSSSIEKQLIALENYKMEIEVCTPIYSRLYSRWTGNFQIEGSLIT